MRTGLLRQLFHLALMLVLVTSVGEALAYADERPLSNSDVVTLSKAGLGDEVVVSKIEQAPRVEFDVSTETLVKLKQQGVSPAVISAMLKRTSPGKQPNAQAPLASGNSPVRLLTKDGALDLLKMAGSIDYAAFSAKTYHTFPGLKAQPRTKDHQPALYIASSANPQGQYYIVKADPSTKKKLRSVKIGGGMLAMRNATAPDEDWTIPYECAQEQPGVWRLTLSKPLETGEYGVYVTSQNQLTAGDLYDFGID